MAAVREGQKEARKGDRMDTTKDTAVALTREQIALYALMEEINIALQDDSLLASGWEAFRLWSSMDPTKRPLDRAIPAWDNLSDEQRLAVQGAVQRVSWGDLSHWESEAFRKAFDLMIGRVLARTMGRVKMHVAGEDGESATGEDEQR